MRRAKNLRLLVGVAVVGLVLAACGSTADDTDTTGAGSDTSSTQEAEQPADTETSDAGEEATDDTADGDSESAEGTAKLGLAYDLGGRGDQSFNDSAARGLDKAAGEGMEIVGELTAAADEPDSEKVNRLNQLVSDGANAIVAVGFAYAGPLGEVAPNHPDIHFGIVDDASLCLSPDEGGVEGAPFANVACMTFAEEQGSFLVGVAAALKSQTGKVAYIGGVDVPLIQKFQAGFDAGALAANPDIELASKYISEPPEFSGFNDPASGQTIAKGMYDDGFDVIYAAAGASGAGVFKAAQAAGAWGIGVDSDQHEIPALSDVKDVIITSMVKNVDVAVYDFFSSVNSGTALTGQHIYDLEAGGVSYATSGGFIDDIVPQLEEWKQKIISGEVEVPSAIG